MITAIVGPMFSGKSTELIRRLERAQIAGKNVVLIRPDTDTRGQLTHNRSRVAIDPIFLPSLEFFDPTGIDVVGIDEGQFFPDLARYANDYAGFGAHVIVTGLPLTSELKPFTSIVELLPFAEEIVRLNAVCARCGSDFGAFTHFKAGRKTQEVLVGGSDKYDSLCRACYFTLNRDLEGGGQT
ncbi:MAG: thymidine kinase [Bacteroidota bacterium]